MPRLPVAVPANLSSALGYTGTERFIAVYEAFSPLHPPGTLIIEDCHTAESTDPICWNLLCEHPINAPTLQKLGLNLKDQRRLPECQLTEAELLDALRTSRALLLDRSTGAVYFGRADNVRIYMMTAIGEARIDNEVGPSRADSSETPKASKIAPDVVDQFRRSLDAHVLEPAAQWQLGRWYMDRRRAAWALELYDIASKRDPILLDDLSNILALGFACALAGDTERAEESFRRAINADPGNANAYGYLALIQAGQRQSNEALFNARKAVEIAPADPATHIVLGQVLFMTHSANAGAEEVGIALSLGAKAEDLDDTQSILAGFFYHNHGLYLEARRSFEKVIDADPTGHLAAEKSCQLGLASVYLQLGEYRKAIDLSEICAGLHPEPESIQMLATSYLFVGRKQDAVTLLQKSMTSWVPRKNANSESVIGWSYPVFGEYPQAVEHLNEAVLLEPTNVEARAELAKALWRNGRFDSAVQELVKARSMGLTEEDAEEVLEYFGRSSGVSN